MFHFLFMLAPSAAPVLRVNSTTPTSITIAWDEIPCHMRNGKIDRYILHFTSISNCCRANTTVINATIKEFTFRELIPRQSYKILIRADSQSDTFNVHRGNFSPPLYANTSAYRGSSNIPYV